MGVVPDVKAVRTVSKNRPKKIKRVVSCEQRYQPINLTSKDNKSAYTILKYQEQSDEELLNVLRQEDFKNLIADFVTSTEKDIDQNVDKQLINSFNKQELHRIINESGATKEFFLSSIINNRNPNLLGTNIDTKQFDNTILSQENSVIIDSDGDINIRDYSKKRSREVKNITTPLKPILNSTDIPPEVIYRDQDGFKITRQRWLELQFEKKGGFRIRKNIDKEKKKESYKPVEWGRGLIQKKKELEREEREKHIAAQPLAQTQLDEEADKELRGEIRWDDPMRKMIQTTEKKK